MFKRFLSSIALLCVLATALSVGGVFAIWSYYDDTEAAYHNMSPELKGFNYVVEDLPTEEVSLIERLHQILNQEYQTDIVQDSRDYLINKTIQVRWDDNAPPYVGSMDKNYATQIDALFGDIMTDTSLSFILKNQDLNWDGYSEISMYSTVDPLDSSSEWPTGAICVYLTVFAPVLDEQRNVVAYEMICEAIHGYAPKVRYGSTDTTPSFSTDHWRDDIGYMVWNDLTGTSDVYSVPADALSNDGTKAFRYDYNSYSKYYQNIWYATTPYGNTAAQCLDGKIPWLGWW